jgi:hypothetical protein
LSASIRPARGLLAVLAAFAALLIVASSVAATGGSGSGSAYRADIAPGSVPAGTSSDMTITIKQLSSSSDKKVRSARVSAPDGVTIGQVTVKRGNTTLTNVTSTSGSVTVNNIPSLSSNQTVTVSLKASIPCGESGSTWIVGAKNGTDFATGGTPLSQDPASQLSTSVTPCSLAWVQQPASAGRDKVITSVVADPSGTPVQVRLLDGMGGHASQSGVTVSLAIVAGTGASGATLDGTTAVTGSAGIATFAPTINRSERGYRLLATASGVIDSDPSSAFNIDDVAKICSVSGCTGSSVKDTTTAKISASSDGGVLTMSLGLDPLDCHDSANQFYETSSATVTWDITPANDRTEITIRLDKADVTRPYNLYDVCFSSPTSSFRNRYNVKIEKGKAGLLKICPPRLDKQDSDPCVVDKWRDNGDVLIKFSVPPGDPRGRI